jgi:hypothetical protein
VYSLSLIGDNGTFEIIPPHAVTGSQNFTILVKNSAMLDYENHQTLNFKVKKIVKLNAIVKIEEMIILAHRNFSMV